jgi:hypothetical protein
MRIVAPPFRRTSLDRVHAEPWILAVADGALEPLPNVLIHWDYNLDLRLSRALLVDLPGIREDCGLSADDAVSVAVVWRSTGTMVRGCSTIHHLSPGSTTAELVELEAVVPGSQIGGTVVVGTQIVLRGPRPNAPLLTAAQAGSILWQDTSSVDVEGSSSRFPVEVVDFASGLFGPEDAAWYLSWPFDDLYQSFLGRVRLYVNSRHEAAAKAATRSSSAPETDAVLSMIYYDVGRALIRGVLENDEFVSNPDGYPEASIGWTVAGLLRAVLPHDAPAGLQSTMRERPSEFDSVLQAGFRLLKD